MVFPVSVKAQQQRVQVPGRDESKLNPQNGLGVQMEEDRGVKLGNKNSRGLARSPT